jgi:cytochrome c-type biogenesis protein CcmH
MIWLLILAMTAVAVAALVMPLRRTRGVRARRDYDAAVYRDQLAELARDQARGTIDAAEAAAARAEIGRRLLAAAGAEEAAPAKTQSGQSRSPRPLALTLALVAPLASVVLYLAAGSPGLPDRPFAARPIEEPVEARIARIVGELQRRVSEHPDDLQGWRMLAIGLGGLGRPGEAVAAWRRVMQLSHDAPEFAAQLGESLVQEAGGAVTPEALAAFERAHAADARDFRARFYIGLARAQAGDPRAALQTWTDMVAAAPPDAAWVAAVEERIQATARDAGIDSATIAPSAAAQAEAQARAPEAAIASLPPEQRNQAIRGMVEGLAARLETQPDDLDGWRRLARAWMVLGEKESARAAYARAAALAPQNVEILSDYAQTWGDELADGRPLPPDYVALMRRILALDPDYADALWFVGLAEIEAGNRAAAIALWDRLVQRLPADSAEGREVRARLERLRATQ